MENEVVPWQAVFAPKDVVARTFKSEKTGRELCEILMPTELPEGAPVIGGYHFYMPVGCVKEAKTGAMRITFPPSWESIRFLSPYVKGKRPDVVELPIEDALALLRDTFATKKK